MEKIMSDTKKQPLWTFNFIYLLIIGSIFATAFTITNPLIPGFLVSIGATLAVAGTITAVFAFMALLGRPIASVLGDRRNKKNLFILFFVIHGVFTMLYALAPSIAWVIPFRIIRALSFSVGGTVLAAIGADCIPETRMGEGLGILGLSNMVGMAIGPAIGIELLRFFENDYRPLFFISGGGMVFAAIISIFLKYKPKIQEKMATKGKIGLGEMISIKVLPLALFVAIFAFGNGITVSFLVLLSEERSLLNVGIYFILNAVVTMASRPFIGRLTDKKGVPFVILPAFLFATVSLLLIGFATASWHILVAAVLMAFGKGIAFPGIKTACVQKLSPAQRTLAMGTFLIGMDIGFGAGPMIGGVIAEATSFTTAFVVAAVVTFIGFLAYWGYTSKSSILTSD